MSAEPNVFLAYWLIPAEPARSLFESTITQLASRFDAPLFEPHLTVYASAQGGDPQRILNQTLRGVPPLRLSIRDVRFSEEFTKTLFVQFESNAEVTRLSEALQKASSTQADYEFNPHLSLIYKEMTQAAKVDLASSIRLPFTEILFDSVKAIVCPAVIRSREDVEAWRVVATRSLTQ